MYESVVKILAGVSLTIGILTFLVIVGVGLYCWIEDKKYISPFGDSDCVLDCLLALIFMLIGVLSSIGWAVCLPVEMIAALVFYAKYIRERQRDGSSFDAANKQLRVEIKKFFTIKSMIESR